jgi:serine/threonine-protein kinase
VPDPLALSSDAELRALAERALSSHYELDRELGRGGMGIVYRARDRRLKRMVAIKLLPPELAFRGEIRSRFLREAETAAQLNHPDIVPIYSVDEREGLVFFVMACIDGITLARRLHDEGQLPIGDVRRILREVADALAYAHARGVIHRDIKPDNILLDPESGRAMVTDFGIARAIQEGSDSRLTATGVAIGTPAYMSPEQAAGDREIDGRSDLYALGVVAYQMLAGRLPFQATNTASMLMKHITERPTPIAELRPDVPRDLGAVVMTLLEKEPAHRAPDASVVVRALSGDVGAIPLVRTTDSTKPSESHSPHSAPAGPEWSPPSHTQAPPGQYGGDAYASPTAHELARWSAPEVERFRASFARYGFVNAVIVIAAVLTSVDFVWITVVWSMVMAVKYSKLWSAGYDWRDVFRQPRHRRLTDVVHEFGEEIAAGFDKKKRAELAARRAERLASPGTPPALGAPAESADYGRHGHTVQRAEQDLADIVRGMNALPKSDRALVEDVIPSASALLQRIQSLARSLVELERLRPPGAAERMDGEIATLEAQANPLDTEGSEQRVRRLALLKRERRALADAERRSVEDAGKLESCSIALQNMRLDVLRLRAGGVASVTQHITLLTERARSLAEGVDAVVQGVNDAWRGAEMPRRGERDRV